MQISFPSAPARSHPERASVKVALAATSKGNGLSQVLPLASAKIGGTPRRLEWANSDCPGLLLLDALRQPLYANDEALSILTYPGRPPANGHLSHLLVRKIDSLLRKQNDSSSSKEPAEIASGKRLYQVRVFTLRSHFGNSIGPSVAVLLERNGGHVDVMQAAQKFHLTQREAQALDLLMQGSTTKQIASRMNISPNTAKAFLRSVMSKTGACNRSGILARILQLSKAAAG